MVRLRGWGFTGARLAVSFGPTGFPRRADEVSLERRGQDGNFHSAIRSFAEAKFIKTKDWRI